jgi:hypothetical protein
VARGADAMMFAYLSFSGARVILHTANRVAADPEESAEISFLDEQGRTVATFQRRDVSVYSKTDYGPSLQELI